MRQHVYTVFVFNRPVGNYWSLNKALARLERHHLRTSRRDGIYVLKRSQHSTVLGMGPRYWT